LESSKIAKELVAVRFEVGDWILQERNGIYGLVVGILKNGAPKAVTYSEEFHRKPKLDKTVRNWYPAPIKISESQVPSKIRQKIRNVAPRFMASRKTAMDEWIDNELKKNVKQLANLAKREAEVTSVKGNRIEMGWNGTPMLVDVTYFGFLGDEDERIDGISLMARDPNTKRPLTLPAEAEPDADAREMWKVLSNQLKRKLK
jgi:hypothetical protein